MTRSSPPYAAAQDELERLITALPAGAKALEQSLEAFLHTQGVVFKLFVLQVDVEPAGAAGKRHLPAKASFGFAHVLATLRAVERDLLACAGLLDHMAAAPVQDVFAEGNARSRDPAWAETMAELAELGQ